MDVFVCDLGHGSGRLGVASISGLVVEYIVAIDVTRVRFPADASMYCTAPHVPIALGGWSTTMARWALDVHIRYSLAG